MKIKLKINLTMLKNVHRISQDSKITYVTARNYLLHPEAIQIINLDILSRLLFLGFGLDRETVEEMKVKDLFEIVEGCDEC